MMMKILCLTMLILVLINKVKSNCTGVNCNSGYCTVNPNGTPKCICNPGYSGGNCQTYVGISNSCWPNPCRNSGSCFVSVFGGIFCSCPYGYTGTYCESSTGLINNCFPNPCKNGGQCSCPMFQCSCSCPIGYSGPLCETVTLQYCPTYNNPCKNGAKCYVMYNTPICECPYGYTGTYCDSFTNIGIINPCYPNPCQNNGQCFTTNSGSSYNCQCQSGYFGINCEQGSPSTCYDSGTNCQAYLSMGLCSYSAIVTSCRRTWGYCFLTNVTIKDFFITFCLLSSHC